MSALTLTYNGSVTIPESIFQSAHIQKGDQIQVRVEGECVVLERQPENVAKASVVAGKYGRKALRAPVGSPPMTVKSVREQLEELDSQ